jgi:beta-xylosidase
LLSALISLNIPGYVLWANVGAGPGAPYAVATSSSPDGPFKYHGVAKTDHGGGGDMALFLDDDGSAYCVITRLVNGAGPRDMQVYKLTDDFLNFSPATSGTLPGPKLVEAPDMIKRQGTYYILLGGCTCFGFHGSGVAYLTASSPLGPYTHRSSVLDPGCNITATPNCFDVGPAGPSQERQHYGQNTSSYTASGLCRPVLQAQQNFVIQYPSPTGVGYIWTGDRWNAAPDGLFGHDPQTWAPMTFDAEGAIMPMAFHESFAIELAL